jgi:glycosyltransferase involved in cell wall biosynthesis
MVGATQKRIDLGLVTNASAGWKTVRRRWETDLAMYAPTLHHIEDHWRLLASVTERFGPRSIGHALAGRAAARAALDAGAKVILLSTLQNAPFAPLERGVRYIVYGDCTSSQLATNYGGKTLGAPGSWICARIRRLREHGCIFLCMSQWYRDALREEFEIPENQLQLLPFYVDTEIWKPLANKARNARKQVLFIGGDLARKGADIVYELARQNKFKDVDFHIVSPHAEAGPSNIHPHRGLTSDSPDLVRLTAECDLFILPTRADASPISALEAAACGLPAIITGRGGIREIVVDGVTGTVLPEPKFDAFEKELSTYLDNSDMLAERGRCARLHVEQNYSKTRHMQILHGVIARAAASVQSPAADLADTVQETIGATRPVTGNAI